MGFLLKRQIGLSFNLILQYTYVIVVDDLKKDLYGYVWIH